MLSQFTRLSASLKQSISFVIKPKGRRYFVNTVRIPKANKVVETRHRSAKRVGGIIQIAALIGLPIVYNAATPKSVAQLSRGMAEESNLESVLQNADQLYDENFFQEVVDVLEKYKDQSSPDVQWRKARAIYSLSKSIKDKQEREKQIVKAFELIKAALESDPNNFAVHKWMAVILDSNSDLQGIKARILQLDNIKFHMVEALRLNPEDPTTWHMMGAYEYGLAELSWIQRKLVSTIFASPPTGCFDKALEYFEKAESLKEGFYSTNWLMIGKCHIALKQNEKAKIFLEKAANCAVLNEDDKKCKEEAVALLKKV